MKDTTHLPRHSPFHVSCPTPTPLPPTTKMDLQDDVDYLSFLSPYPWMEPSQYHWDWSIPDPPAGAVATPSQAHLPQAAEIPRDREMVSPPGL